MSGFVYVVQSSSGLFKIGYSTDPRRRLTMLRTSSPDRLTLLGVVPGTMEDEKELHHLLQPWRVAREWFRPCRAMQPLLDKLRHIQEFGGRRHLGPIADIIERMGGPTLAAKQLGIGNPSVVINWRTRNSIPPEHVVAVARLTGIPAAQLRPDIFGEAA